MKPFKKIFFGILFFILIVCTVSYYFRSLQVAVIQYAEIPHSVENYSVEQIENALAQSCQQQQGTIIPCDWYSEGSFMPPVVAGMLDGAYLAGESLADIAAMVYHYIHNAEYRAKLHELAANAWQQRQEIAKMLKSSVHEFGQDVSYQNGSNRAEYQYGKVIFEAGGLLFGISELKSVNRVGDLIEVVDKQIKMSKALRIKVNCKVCAKMFNARHKLRDEFLIHHLDDTKRLLHNEWKASGKKWEVFIADYEAHHIIPVDALENSVGLRFYYNNGGTFNFNSTQNGAIIKKLYYGGEHANHPSYNVAMIKKIDEIYENVNNFDLPLEQKMVQFDKRLKQLIIDTRNLLDKKCKGENLKVNEIFDND